VNTAKEQGEEINGGEAGGKTEFFDKKITHGSDHDGYGDEEFNPLARHIDKRECTHSKGDGMADGKGGNKDQYFFPIGKLVPQAKGSQEQDMIYALPVGNVLKPYFQVQTKIIHLLVR
jgi:hypothetical protein